MIRPATAADLPTLAETMRRAWLFAYAQLLPFANIQRWACEDWSRNQAAEQWPEITVFDVEGRAVGMVRTAGPDVSDLFVHPAFHRRGLGTALLHHAEARIVESGYDRAESRGCEGCAHPIHADFHLKRSLSGFAHPRFGQSFDRTIIAEP